MSDNFYNYKAGRVITLWGATKGSHLLLPLDYKKWCTKDCFAFW